MKILLEMDKALFDRLEVQAYLEGLSVHNLIVVAATGHVERFERYYSKRPEMYRRAVAGYLALRKGEKKRVRV